MENTKKLFIFCWYDKIDKCYLQDSVRIHYSVRAICRGFLNEFEQNKKMNFNEFDLCTIGEFDEFTGVIKAYPEPVVLDPKIVYGDEQKEVSA